VLFSYLNFSFVLLAKIEAVLFVVPVIVAIFVELKVELAVELRAGLVVVLEVELAVVLRAGLVVGLVVVGWLAYVLEIIIHLHLIHNLLSEVVVHSQHSNDILDQHEQLSFPYYLVTDLFFVVI